MKTQKEKAEEIFIKMLSNTFEQNETDECRHTAKQCSIDCVDEIIESFSLCDENWRIRMLLFWNEVKIELQKYD